MKCNQRIFYNKQGKVERVLDRKGQDSRLYRELVESSRDEDLALKLWAVSETEGFNRYNESKENKTEPLTNTVLKYLNAVNLDAEVLSLDDSQYTTQINQSSSVSQRETFQKLMVLQSKIFLKDGQYKVKGDSNEYIRVSDKIASFEGYGFKGNSEEYEKNRQWGNKIDSILESVVQGKSLDQALALVSLMPNLGVVNESELIKAYEYFDRYVRKENQQGNVIMTQVKLFNRVKKTAGTADIVVIRPDGSVKVVDLKTSVKKTGYNKETGEFNKETVTSKAGNEYEAGYDVSFGKNKSKKQQHEAQTSMYSGMLEAHGFNSDIKQEIIPINLVADENTVSEIIPEEHIPLNRNNLFFSLVNEDYISNNNVDITKSDTFTRMITEAKKIIFDQIETLKKAKKDNQAFHVNKLLEILNVANDTEEINRFISELYNTMMGDDYWKGYIKIAKSKIAKIKQGDNATLQDINDVEEALNVLRLFDKSNNELISNLSYLIDKERKEGSIIEPDSPLDKLNQINRELNNALKEAEEALPKFYAKLLDSDSTTSSSKQVTVKLKALGERIKRRKNRLANASDKQKEKIEKGIQKLKNEIKKLGGEWMDEINEVKLTSDLTLENQIINGGYKDILAVDRWLTPTISMANDIVALFAKKVKKNFQEARVKSVETAKEINEAYKKYSKDIGSNFNHRKFNRAMYDKVQVSGKERMSFVTPLDYSRFRKEQSKIHEKAEELQAEGKNAQARELISNWYRDNTEERPEKDVTVDGVIVIYGTESLIAKKKKEFNNNEAMLKTWINKNTFNNRYTKELALPLISKYNSQKFKDLTGNRSYSNVNQLQAILNSKGKAEFEYYKVLIKKYFEAQAKYPTTREEQMFLLPSIGKTSWEKYLETTGLKDTANNIKYDIQDIFKYKNEDYGIYGDNSNDTIPILFTQYMEADNVSLDLTYSVIRFIDAANRYEKQKELKGLGYGLLEQVSKNKPAQTNSSGFKIIHSAAKRLGLSSENVYLDKHKGNNVAAALEAFIDVQIMGKKKIKETLNVPLLGEVDLNKLAGSIIGYSSKTQVALNPLTSLANLLQQNVMVAIEGVAGEYFTKKNWAKAQKEYAKLEAKGAFFKGRYIEGVPEHWINKVIELYDPLQEENGKKTGQNITKHISKKLISWDTAYMLQHKGEHQTAVTGMIALMQNTAYTHTNGENTTLYDAIEKYGVENVKFQDDVQQRIHAINKRLFGVYNDFDDVELSRYWYGSLVMMYRKFIVPGFKKRYKSFGTDHELGGATEGSYRTFFKALFQDTQALTFMLMPKAVRPMFKNRFEELGINEEYVNKAYTQMERANITRTLMELTAVMILGALVMSLKSLGEDDDELKDSYPYNFALASSMRLLSELKFYGMIGDINKGFIVPPVGDMLRVLETPTIAFGTVKKAKNLILQVGSPMEVYERDYGVWEKGESKLKVKAYKLLGFTGNNIDPAGAVKLLELTTN